MCTCRMNRRTMISLSGAAPLLMLGGCDDVDLVADETVEAMDCKRGQRYANRPE